MQEHRGIQRDREVALGCKSTGTTDRDKSNFGPSAHGDDDEKGKRLQEADARCKRRAWLQEHEPEQVEERMEALGAASKEWVSHTVVECGLARSKSVRPLPIERDFVEAMVLLQGNPFLAEMFIDNSVFPPGRVYAMGPHAIQLGDTGVGRRRECGPLQR